LWIRRPICVGWKNSRFKYSTSSGPLATTF
jgi:hypothetical protein